MRSLGRIMARLRADRSGNVSILVGTGMTMLIGASALAVDVGSIYFDQRRLQGIADAAALAAASSQVDSRAAALRAISAACDCDIRLMEVTSGTYTRDAAIDPDLRFAAGGNDGNAVRVTVQQVHPLIFGRYLLDRDTSDIRASATASRVGYTAFSLGARPLGVNGGLPNALLSGLAGSDLAISVMDYNALAAADIDLLRFADALRTRIGANGATFGQVLATEVTVPQVLDAMADVAPGGAAAVLRRMASRADPNRIVPALQIDLGPRAANTSVDPANPVNVDTFWLSRAFLELGSPERQIDVGLSNALPGGSTTELSFIVGQPLVDSPLLSITEAGDVVVRTAQSRLLLDTRLVTPVGRVHVPIYVELGSAQAQLTDIRCRRSASGGGGVTLSVTPSPGTLAIGRITSGDFDDMTSELRFGPAQLLALPLVRVDGGSTVVLSDLQAQSVSFTRDDISARRFKTVTSSGAAQGIASSLAQRLTLNAQVAGIGVSGTSTQALVATALGAAAPALDTILQQATGVLGVHVGQADTRVNILRCGHAVLVG